jgi:undecaprenyl-phosphate 4-deoxy-4-formamido-L-arabinose transferase
MHPRAVVAPQLSVVIPAYNSERSLPLVVQQVRDILRGASMTCEFILVDDASRDATWTVIEDLARANADVRGIHFRRNFGQHNALLAGIRAARGGTIITMDDDLQHPAEEVPRLLAKLAEGFDVVYGYPQGVPHSIGRQLFSSVTKIALQKTMGADTARHHSAFRVFRTTLRDAFVDYTGAYVSIDVLLTWATSKFAWIYVSHRRREMGKSNYTLARLFTHAMTLITGFSTVPLRLASIVGLAFTLFGVLILTYVVGRYLIQGAAVPGFAFLASSIAIFSGVQLFALGIMGEYLARIHTRSLGRPAYVIADTTAKAEELPMQDAQRRLS